MGKAASRLRGPGSTFDDANVTGFANPNVDLDGFVGGGGGGGGGVDGGDPGATAYQEPPVNGGGSGSGGGVYQEPPPRNNGNGKNNNLDMGSDSGYMEARKAVKVGIQDESAYQKVRPVLEGVAARDKAAGGGYKAIDPNWLGEQNAELMKMPWFRGVYSRRQATIELQNLPEGMFLVRVSSVPGKYAISTNFGYKVENMLILPSWDPTKRAQGETLYRLGTTSKTFFANIPDLIVFYCTNTFYTDKYGAKHKLLAPEGSAAAHTGYLDVRPGEMMGGLSSGGGINGGGGGGPPGDGSQLQVTDEGDGGYLNVKGLGDAGGLTPEEALDAALAGGEGEEALDENVLDFPAPVPSAVPAPNNPFAGVVAPPEDPNQERLALEDSELKVYNELFKQADATSSGAIGAADGVTFFRNSGLSDQVLGGIWALADAQRRGSLNRDEFFTACKLVALAQADTPAAAASLKGDLKRRTPLPDFGELSIVAARHAGHVAVGGLTGGEAGDEV